MISITLPSVPLTAFCVITSVKKSIWVLVDLAWKEMNVFEKNIKIEKNKKKKKKEMTFYGELSESKIVQFSGTVVYLLGGHANYPSLLEGNYEVPRSCVRLDMNTRELSRKKPMKTGRHSFGVCSDGTYIYVLGGA